MEVASGDGLFWSSSPLTLLPSFDFQMGPAPCGGLLTSVDLDPFAGDVEDGMLRGWRGGGVLGMHSGRKKEEGRGEDRIEMAASHCRIVYASTVMQVWRNETECGRSG
jgi:hypothetical protein